MHSIKKTIVPICTECGEKMIRQISGGGSLQFKGTGFYKTDYKDKEDSG